MNFVCNVLKELFFLEYRIRKYISARERLCVFLFYINLLELVGEHLWGRLTKQGRGCLCCISVMIEMFSSKSLFITVYHPIIHLISSVHKQIWYSAQFPFHFYLFASSKKKVLWREALSFKQLRKQQSSYLLLRCWLTFIPWVFLRNFQSSSCHLSFPFFLYLSLSLPPCLHL